MRLESLRAIFWVLGLAFILFCVEVKGFTAQQPSPGPKTCTDCHQVTLDKAHRLPCTRCHGGQSPASSVAQAHEHLKAHPASPVLMEHTCGPCHAKEVRRLRTSLHYTLAGEINLVRKAFGLAPVPAADKLPQPKEITSVEDLVDDLLRRRCLRCHLFYAGDDYAETKHGLGCAACHLVFAQGRCQSHRFVKQPPDRNCLHCHYENHVGWDYYGMFAHDYPYQFRSPLLGGRLPPRPWGIEFHELTPDIHLKKGMSCLACHTQDEIMGDGRLYATEAQAVKVRCTDCHQVANTKKAFHHPKVLARARCSACHALWSFQDEGFYLMLQDDPDWDDWVDLMVQGSSEIEKEVETYLRIGKARAQMKDKFTGQEYPGVWFLGFGWRRFEKVPLGFDKQGRLSVIRPLLSLHLSYVNADGEVLFDDLVPPLLKKSPQAAYVPYTPHTIGPADTFRSLKVLEKLGLLKELLGGKSALSKP